MAKDESDTWLVVYQPLWKIWVRQLGWWNSQYNNILEDKKMFQTTNQLCMLMRFWWWVLKVRCHDRNDRMDESEDSSWSMDWLKGKLKPETMVFTIKYRGFRFNFSHHPILWLASMFDRMTDRVIPLVILYPSVIKHGLLGNPWTKWRF